MGGITDSLFGSAPEANTESVATMTPEQQAFLKKLLAELTPQIGNVSSQGTYSGPFTAPLNNLQSLSLDSIENLSKEMGSSTSYINAMGALDKMTATGGKQDITDVFQNSIVNPAMKNFTEKVMPGVIGNFGGMGAYGSDKQKQSQIAMRNLNDSVLAAGSDLAFKAGDSANKNILSALGLTPAMTNIPMDYFTKALGAGTLSNANAQVGISNQLEYLKSQNANKQATLQAMIGALGLKPTENISTVTGGSSGSAGGLMQGAAALYSSGIFSDQRLKSHIQRIGSHILGFGVYLYKIFGKWEVGFMAQEVMLVKPEAVSIHSSGYMQVNYSML